MTKCNHKYNSGYIEGYYGKLLNWHERKRILKSLHDNKLNTYFYAPKEDTYHRFNWKKDYPNYWYKEFNNFCRIANKNKIQIIFGISPGLQFDFNEAEFKKSKDFEMLIKKARKVLKNGANSICILYDDIKDNFFEMFPTLKSEGNAHAAIVNKLQEHLNCKIYVVPRVYANELVQEDNAYLHEFLMKIKKEISIFYCGTNIVTTKINPLYDIECLRKANNQIIYWDNCYANDYCPRRLFLGPWKNSKLKNIMINLTGMIETDLFIIDIITKSSKLGATKETWIKTLTKFNVPKAFHNLYSYFNMPNKKALKPNKFRNLKFFDKLLWEWKTPLSREWYPYLLTLKQDLEIKMKIVGEERILKTQTHPLSSVLLKRN